jgi:hypothetical protein
MGALAVRIGDCGLGRGLFAVAGFHANDLILVLKGPRYEREDPIHETPEGANLLQTGRRTYILLREPGVYANHSCDPNAGIRANRRLVAIRDIAAGEEIRFDYSTTMDEDYWTLDCRCGAACCRGRVTDFHQLPDEVRGRYLALDVVQGFIARRARSRPARNRAVTAA